MKKQEGIPVTFSGPGSQPLEEDGSQLEFIALPKEMNSYRAPDIPAPDQVQHLSGARAVTDWLDRALAAYNGSLGSNKYPNKVFAQMRRFKATREDTAMTKG